MECTFFEIPIYIYIYGTPPQRSTGFRVKNEYNRRIAASPVKETSAFESASKNLS